MKPGIWLGLLLLQQALASGANQAPDPSTGSGGINAPHQLDKPYLILISIDGYRWDYPERYPTPTIRSLISEGWRAERLIPAWPSLTFPNHFTIVTGRHPADHGLVGNNFFDPRSNRWYRLSDRASVQDGSFYHSEPIWVTAETQGMVTASFFWVGSEADVMGVRPTHWRVFSKKISGEQRVDQVLAWLAEPPDTRPHLYTLYFEEVDDHAHWFGPGSLQFAAALERVDGWLARLLAGIRNLSHGDRVNLMLVSDHGQMPYRAEPAFVLDQHINLEGWSLTEGGPYVLAWNEEADERSAKSLANAVNGVWRHGHAYTSDTAPRDWRLDGNERMPRLVFQADPGYAVISSAQMTHKMTAGDHGWAPAAPDMHGVFIASGPQVGHDWPAAAMRSWEVHPLMLEVLDLSPPGVDDR